jgi:hypothetical protein
LGERIRFLPDGKSLIYMQGLLASTDFWLLDLASMKSRPLTSLPATRGWSGAAGPSARLIPTGWVVPNQAARLIVDVKSPDFVN